MYLTKRTLPSRCFTGLARQAQVSPNERGAVLARFWDKTWTSSNQKPKFVVLVEHEFLEIIYNSSLKFNGGPTDKRARALWILDNAVAWATEKRKFKPEVEVLFEDSAPNGTYRTLGYHPNGLYKIVADEPNLKLLADAELFLEQHEFPTKEQAKEAHGDMFNKKKQKDAAGNAVPEEPVQHVPKDDDGTESNVTGMSIKRAKNWAPNLGQTELMGDMSPSLVRISAQEPFQR